MPFVFLEMRVSFLNYKRKNNYWYVQNVEYKIDQGNEKIFIEFQWRQFQVNNWTVIAWFFPTTTNTEEDKSMYALHHNLGHAPIDFFQIILYYHDQNSTKC